MKKILIFFLFSLAAITLWGQQATYEEAMRKGRAAINKSKPDFRAAVVQFGAAEAAAIRSKNERNIDAADKALRAAKDGLIGQLDADKKALEAANLALAKAQDSLLSFNKRLEQTNDRLEQLNKELVAEKRKVEQQRDKADARRLALQADNLLADREYETALDLTYYAYQLDSQLTDVNLSFGNAVYQQSAQIINYALADTLTQINKAILSPTINQALIAGSSGSGYSESAFQLRLLTLGNEKKTLRITNDQSLTFNGNTGVLSLNYSSDGKQFLTGAKDGRLLVWDEKGNALGDFSAEDGAFLAACFLAGKQRVLAGLRNGVAQVWDVGQKKTIKELKGLRQGSVYSVDYAPTARRLLTRSSDRIVQLWDAENFKSINDGVDHPLYAYKAVFSPDGRQFLTVAADEITTVRLWNSDDGGLIKTIKSPAGAAALDAGYSKDGRRIYVLREDNTLQIHDAQGNELKTIDEGVFPANLTTAAFSPDGRYLLAGMESGLALLLDAESGEPVMRLDKLETPIRQTAFSADGTILLTLSQRGRLVVANSPDWMREQMKRLPPDWTEEEKKRYDIRNDQEVRR